MRSIIPTLLVTLAATTLGARPMTCCPGNAGETKGGACHRVPAQPTPCQQVETRNCLDFACEPERLTAIAPALIGQRVSPDPHGQYLNVLAADAIAPGMLLARELVAAHGLALHHAAGKLFLRNRVLLI
jgi:hypothetical protein